MELNWTTFILELFNFLVLIWILKRFLYLPVLKVIETRRKRVEQTLEHARNDRRDAESLRHDFETRLSQWESEQDKAHETLRQELQEEKARRLAQLEQELQTEREKAVALTRRSEEEEQRHLQLLAMQQGSEFTSRLLARIADGALQVRLLDMLLEDLQRLTDEQQNHLQAAIQEADAGIEVVSAMPLDDTQRQQLHAAFAGLSGDIPLQWQFHEDAELMAGVRITIGAWVLRVNLQDELRFFTEAYQDGS